MHYTYPNDKEIAVMFESLLPDGKKNVEAAKSMCSASFKWIVPGSVKDHLNTEHQGIDGLRNTLTKIDAVVDHSKPSSIKVLRVIGGGDDPYAAIELVATGTSSTGKPWHNESVMIARFTKDGKLDMVKWFADTHHLNEHFKEGSSA